MEAKRILIAEDESIIAMELENSLESLGYQVTSIVNSGEKAIDRVQKDHPDIVLMDIRLKGDLDGMKAASIIRSKFDTPIVFLTAFLDDDRLEKAKLSMPFGYLLKPVQNRELRITIEMALYVAQVDTKRRQLEMEVRKNEEKYRLLYERAPLSYQSLDENGYFIEVNEFWLNQLGYSREEVIGKSFGDFIHPDWSDHFKENFPRFKSMGEIIGVEFEMVKKDGSMILVSFNGRIGHDENGNFKQTHCILKDITDQKKLETSLYDAEAKWKAVLDNFPDQTIIIDLEGRIEYINSTEELETEYYLGKSIFNILDDDACLTVKENMRKVMETGLKQRFKTRYRFSHGKKVEFSSHIGPIKQSAQITGFTITNKVP